MYKARQIGEGTTLCSVLHGSHYCYNGLTRFDFVEQLRRVRPSALVSN